VKPTRPLGMNRPVRSPRVRTWDNVIDGGLQHERTALAWERTAISTMVMGLLLARYAALVGAWPVAFIGVLQTVAGSSVLVWTGKHYDALHAPLQQGDGVVHPRAAATVGLMTIAFTGTAFVLALLTLFG
jgi:hypothetical protein